MTVLAFLWYWQFAILLPLQPEIKIKHILGSEASWNTSQYCTPKIGSAVIKQTFLEFFFVVEALLLSLCHSFYEIFVLVWGFEWVVVKEC